MTPEDTPTNLDIADEALDEAELCDSGAPPRPAGEDQADNPPGDVTAVGPATADGPDPAELDPELGISAERPALDPQAGPQDGPDA